jgi:DNA-binding winged helix-turn-helix (wHTH) protein
MPSCIHRFAAFELDQSQRTLRLEGREIPLQPRVFDLLWYLVEHRDRVVSKEELLDTLWPGIVVTESSLQRAVSLARSALQQGGLEGAIRNYARRGYRFQVEEAGAATTPAVTETVVLAEAERAYAAAQWQDALSAYARADQSHPLNAEELEHWGIAAQCVGDLAGAVAPLERAAIVYSSNGKREAAARVLISLARIQMESLDLAVAQGCLRRADRLLSGLPRGEQHGYLAWMTARLHLNKGELPEAIQRAQEACDIGHELGNADIESMGMMIWGIGLQASGDAKTGLALQDEAAAAVLSGNVSPLVGGLVYCGIISGCCNGEDWQRAGQWTESFTRWCQRSNIDTFAGACLIHQAEIFAMSGKLDDARDAILRADPMVRLGAPWALGDAHRLMGDVHLARGELDEAERCYQQAYQHGWEPYPGYAELLHLRGRGEEAIRGLKRAASLTHWVAGERKARYLALATQIAAMLGQREEARELLQVLDDAPHMWEFGAIAGQVDRARAELAWAEGQMDEAMRQLLRALQSLHHSGAVMETARVHLRLAELFTCRGDPDAVNMELSAAEAMFHSAGAEGYLAQCHALRDTLSAP